MGRGQTESCQGAERRGRTCPGPGLAMKALPPGGKRQRATWQEKDPLDLFEEVEGTRLGQARGHRGLRSRRRDHQEVSLRSHSQPATRDGQGKHQGALWAAVTPRVCPQAPGAGQGQSWSAGSAGRRKSQAQGTAPAINEHGPGAAFR